LYDPLWQPHFHAAAVIWRYTGRLTIIGAGFTDCVAALTVAKAGISVSMIKAKNGGLGGSNRNVWMLTLPCWR